MIAVLSMGLLSASLLLYTGTEEIPVKPDKAVISTNPVPICEAFCNRFKDEREFLICMDGCKAAAEMKRKKRSSRPHEKQSNLTR